MRLDTTRQPLGVVLVTIVLLTLLFWSRALAYPLPIEKSDMWLSALGRLIAGVNGGVKAVASIFLVLLNATIITRIGTKNILYTAKTFIPFIFYTILSCGIYISSDSFNLLLGSLFLLMGLEVFISGFHRQRNVDSCFTGGLLFGIAGLVYTPLFILLPAVPIILLLFFRDGREQTSGVIGALIPLLAISYIEWGAGGDFLATPTETLRYFITIPEAPLRFNSLNLSTGFIFAIVIFLITLSIGALGSSRRHIRTRPMRISIAAIVMIVCFTTLLFLPCSSAAIVQMMAIPIAIIAPHFFVRYSGRAALILYTLLIISVVMLNIARMS